MKKEDLTIVTRDIPTKFVSTTYGELALNSLIGILEDLEGTDSWGSVLVIYNEEIGNYLESLEIAHKTVRGSYVVNNEGKREELLNLLMEI